MRENTAMKGEVIVLLLLFFVSDYPTPWSVPLLPYQAIPQPTMQDEDYLVPRALLPEGFPPGGVRNEWGPGNPMSGGESNPPPPNPRTGTWDGGGCLQQFSPASPMLQAT